MATGMPVTISARNEVSSVPVIVGRRNALARLPRVRALGGRRRSFDRLLDRMLGPLEQAKPRRQFSIATWTERTVAAAKPIAHTP